MSSVIVLRLNCLPGRKPLISSKVTTTFMAAHMPRAMSTVNFSWLLVIEVRLTSAVRTARKIQRNMTATRSPIWRRWASKFSSSARARTSLCRWSLATTGWLLIEISELGGRIAAAGYHPPSPIAPCERWGFGSSRQAWRPRSRNELAANGVGSRELHGGNKNEAGRHPPRQLDHGRRPGERRLLRRQDGIAVGQEDCQPGRPDGLPPVLRRRQGQPGSGPDLLRVSGGPSWPSGARHDPPDRPSGRLRGVARLLGATPGPGAAVEGITCVLRPGGPWVGAPRGRGDRRRTDSVASRGTGRARDPGIRRGARVHLQTRSQP